MEGQNESNSGDRNKKSIVSQIRIKQENKDWYVCQVFDDEPHLRMHCDKFECNFRVKGKFLRIFFLLHFKVFVVI